MTREILKDNIRIGNRGKTIIDEIKCKKKDTKERLLPVRQLKAEETVLGSDNERNICYEFSKLMVKAEVKM